MYDSNPPQPGFYPFGDYVPPGYPKLNTRVPDKQSAFMFPDLPRPSNVPTHDKGITLSPRKPMGRRRPVAVENVEDQRPFGWTDPVEKPIFQLPEDIPEAPKSIKRRRGRPQTRWIDVVRKDVAKVCFSLNEAERIAADKKAWAHKADQCLRSWD